MTIQFFALFPALLRGLHFHTALHCDHTVKLLSASELFIEFVSTKSADKGLPQPSKSTAFTADSYPNNSVSANTAHSNPGTSKIQPHHHDMYYHHSGRYNTASYYYFVGVILMSQNHYNTPQRKLTPCILGQISDSLLQTPDDANPEQLTHEPVCSDSPSSLILFLILVTQPSLIIAQSTPHDN